MDLGKETQTRFEPGETAALKASFYVDSSVGADLLTSTTLIDLEDSNDISIDGVVPTAGLRLAVNEAGNFILDRGELPGRETVDGEAVPRLSNFASDAAVPMVHWFTLEAVIKLGIGVDTSELAIDAGFDAAQTPGWCELYLGTGDAVPELILRMAGATAFDKDAALEIFAATDPAAVVRWPDVVDFDLVQVGATNNRSTFDVLLQMDDVSVVRQCP